MAKAKRKKKVTKKDLGRLLDQVLKDIDEEERMSDEEFMKFLPSPEELDRKAEELRQDEDIAKFNDTFDYLLSFLPDDDEEEEEVIAWWEGLLNKLDIPEKDQEFFFLKYGVKMLEEEFKPLRDFFKSQKLDPFQLTPKKFLDMFQNKMNDQQRNLFRALVVALLFIVENAGEPKNAQLMFDPIVPSAVGFFEAMFTMFSNYWPFGIALIIMYSFRDMYQNFLFRTFTAVLALAGCQGKNKDENQSFVEDKAVVCH